MKRPALIFLLLLASAVIMGASLFTCRTVHSYEEMADIRLGWPISFVSANLQRFTPLEYPQCFRVGSPWEDPMRVSWPNVALNLALIFAPLFAVGELAHRTRKKRAPKH